MRRRPPRSTLDRSSAASDVYKRQILTLFGMRVIDVVADIPSQRRTRNTMDLARLFLPKQGFPVKVIDPRRCARRVVTVPTTVEDKTGPTSGVVTDLSKTGCRLQLVTPFFRSHHLT